MCGLTFRVILKYHETEYFENQIEIEINLYTLFDREKCLCSHKHKFKKCLSGLMDKYR